MWGSLLTARACVDSSGIKRLKHTGKSSTMKISIHHPVIHIVLVLSAIIGMIPVPCTAASSDTLISQKGSMMDWTDAHIDDNLIATYVSSSSPPAIGVHHADGTFYKSIPLTNDATELESLEISDGSVYYTEYDTSATMNWRNETVYEYNLATGKKQVIYVTNGPMQRVTKIVADGDHVVMRGGVDDRKLILYTRSTGSHQIIITSHNNIHGLAIDGDRILWGCERVDREPGREIHIYTISTGGDYIIPESKSIRTYGYGDISGDNVAWVISAKEPNYINGIPVRSAESYDMRLTNLISGKTRSVETSQTAPIEVPFISGNTMVWVKKPGVDYNNTDTGTIRTYDITSGTFSNVTSGVASISDFSNGLIVWHKLKPMSFWVTSVTGNPAATLPSTAAVTTTGKGLPGSQNTPVPESPVGAIVIILAVSVGILTNILMKRNRARQI